MTAARVTDLRHRLRGYIPADTTETGHLAQMLALLESRADPFQRHGFEPGHFTASAFVLSPDGASILLILHGKLHRWLQPGGHVDADDLDIEAAARREVSEEVGVSDVEVMLAHGLPFDLDVHAIPETQKEPGHAHFDVRFAFRARILDMQAGSDAQAARWVRLEDVAGLETDASVLRAVGKLLSARP